MRLNCESRLPDATGSDNRDETLFINQLRQVVNFLFASDEFGQ